MTALRVLGLRVTNTSPPRPAWRLLGLYGTITPPTPGQLAWRITGVRGSVTPAAAAPVAWRLISLDGIVGTPITVDAGLDLFNLEPGDPVNLRGSSAPVGVWSQTLGPDVALTVTGASASYVAPVTITRTTLQFTYAVGAITDVVTHVILPTNERAAIGGTWVPLSVRGFAHAAL